MDGEPIPGFKRYIQKYPVLDLGFKVMRLDIPVDLNKLVDWYDNLEKNFQDWKFIYSKHNYMWTNDPGDPTGKTGHALQPDTAWYTLCWNPPTEEGPKPPERGEARPEYKDAGGQELYPRRCFNGYALDLINSLPFKTTRWLVTIHTPGTHMISHQDSPDKLRIHIPIHTNEKSTWIIDGEEYFMEPGYAYLINTSLLHSVNNKGNTDRIHLYGKVSIDACKDFLKIDN